jgi:hypothetical protein
VGTFTAGSEQGKHLFLTKTGGSDDTQELVIGNGLEVGTPTGGDKGTGTINMSGKLYKNNVQLLAAQQTGWTAPTGTADKSGFDADSGTLSLAEVAGALKALIDDLMTHGLIGT